MMKYFDNIKNDGRFLAIGSVVSIAILKSLSGSMSKDDEGDHRFAILDMVNDRMSATQKDGIIRLPQKVSIPQDILDVREIVSLSADSLERYGNMARPGLRDIDFESSLPKINIDGNDYNLYEAALIAKGIPFGPLSSMDISRLQRRLKRSHGFTVEGMLRRLDF